MNRLERAVWGWPLLCLILGTGAVLTLRLRFLPFRQLGAALRLALRRGEGAREGRVNGFGALCTSLAATIGTGNIVGVGTALALGGPGALLWMQLAALLGLSLRYAEGHLAVRYRDALPDGTRRGGPFAYIRLGLGRRWRPLGLLFALLGAAAGLCGAGTFVQIGSVTACLRVFLARCVPGSRSVALFGRPVPLAVVFSGFALTLLAARILLGGIGRVSRFSAAVVPLMGGLYALCCLWIVLSHLGALPGVLRETLRGAFTPAAAGGGLLGVVQAGVSRGVFSNEAGLGTAPIAAAAVDDEDPHRQGLLQMTGPVFDTLLLCTLTGLAILLSGAGAGFGVSAAMEAFARGMPGPELLSLGLLTLCLGLFAFTTVLGWSCYGTACLDELTGGAALPRRCYLALYLLTILAAPYFPVQALWQAASVCSGLMAGPNLLALLLLSGRVSAEARKEDRRRRLPRSRRTARAPRS